MEKMRFSNDCTVASVSMALRMPYSKVLAAAKSIGFVPNAKRGLNIYDLIDAMGYDCDSRVRQQRKWDGVRFTTASTACRIRIPVTGPCIMSIPSLNNRGGYHAVVMMNGIVYDPSNKRTASWDYLQRQRRDAYFGFFREYRPKPVLVSKWVISVQEASMDIIWKNIATDEENDSTEARLAT